jgi:probable F420-dependent oxidoreductase
MRIGFTLPQFGALAHQARDVARFARAIEDLGADSLWVADRLLAPVNPTVGYGGGDTIPKVFHSILDPFAVLAVAASATERVEVGTNVLNAPWYAPAVLARSLTTIDHLSGGRLIAGFGSGWSPEECEAAAVPMRERGARLDEGLDALEALWTTNPAEYHGRHWSVPATHADLQPVRQPRPPIYLAGFAPAALRRVARRADGWLPVVAPGARPVDPATDIAAPMTMIRRLAEQEGRDPDQLGTILRIYPMGSPSVEVTADAIALVEDKAEVDHAFVELMNLADTVDDALDVAGRLLHLAHAR